MPAAKGAFPPIVVREITDIGDFLPLREEWNALLLRGSPRAPFLSHQWIRLWWNHFGAGLRLALFVGHAEGRLVFALPLTEVRERRYGIPFVRLRSLTNRHSFRFHPLAEPGLERAAAQALREALAARERTWHELVLEETPIETPIMAAFREEMPAAGLGVGTWRGSPSPYLPLEGGWEGYHASLKGKHRQNLRNRTRRIAEEGEVRFTVHRQGDRAAMRALDQSLEIEERSWKGAEGSAIAQDPALVSFYRDWLREAGEAGWLRLGMLEVEGIPVAFDLSVAFGGTQYCMKIGFDGDFAAFSPGQLLCQEMLRRCFEEPSSPRLREYDFLGGLTAQKADWTSHVRDVGWVYLHNRNLRGRLLHTLRFRLTPALRRFRK